MGPNCFSHFWVEDGESDIWEDMALNKEAREEESKCGKREVQSEEERTVVKRR